MACPAEEALAELVSGSMPADRRASVLEHVAECESCRFVLVQLAQSDDATDDTHPLTAENDAREIERGTQLGRYVIVEKLGAGGMGVVYAAYDPQLDRKVALKLLRSGWDQGGEARARLLREGQVMARLQSPQVITVLDVGVWEGRDFIAMELIDGWTLGRWLAEEKPPWREVLDALVDAGRGLQAAHAEGLVHRDFKPENVLRAKSGRVAVTDFGLARVDARPDKVDGSAPLTETRTGAMLGTPAYMAPEQIEGESDARSDQFSFCVTAFEALFGQRPFQAATLAGLIDEIRGGRVVRTSGHAAIRRTLLRGLDPDPARRHPSMEALLDELERHRDRRRRQWRAAVSVATLVLVAFGTVQAMRPRCGNGGEKWQGIWDEPRKQALHAVFTASTLPYAEDAWRSVAAILDGYRQRWLSAREDACRARAEQSAEVVSLRMECLDDRLRDARALGRLLDGADGAVIQRSVTAASRLPDLERCADTRALRAKVAPPAGADEIRVQSLAERRATVEAMGNAGRFKEALPEARALAGEVKQLGYRPLEAEVLDVLGDIQESAAEYPAAEASLQAAVLAAEAGGHAEAAVRGWVQLTALYGDRLHKFAEAHGAADHARALLERMGGDPRLEASLDDNLGLTLLEEGKYDDALQIVEKALALRERLDPDHPDTAITLNTLGNLMRQKGEYSGAVKYHERARALFEKALGPSHPKVAQATKNVGNSYWSKGQIDEALALYQKALDIQLRVLGADHPDAAGTRVNIAAVYLQRGKFDEALAEYRQVLAAYEKHFGPDNAEMLPSLNNMTVAYQSKGELQEAEATVRRALAIAEKVYGGEHPEVETALVNLGDVLLSEKQFEPAVAAYRRAVAISEKAVGPEHPHTAEDLGGLGFVFLAQKKPREALPVLERAVAIGDKGEVDPVNQAKMRFGLARALWDVKKDPQARSMALAAKKVLESSGARQAPDVKEIEQWLAR
jgi:tetratricopeptide (TPR) repeat protein/predicted Ser/Thr protein kinase